jgi:NIPSNAP
VTGDTRARHGCSVLEWRRYALHPGQRDTLIELFEREFVETQEAVGIRVLGTFRDSGDPDSFVWLRGFADMPARAEALRAFYGGPVWAEHKDVANATMIDSDDVLLLRPLNAASRLALDTSARPAPGQRRAGSAVASVTICPLEGSDPGEIRSWFAREIEPRLSGDGASIRAVFITEHSPNNYPALPVREGENVLVWLSVFADPAARSKHWSRTDLASLLAGRAAGEPQMSWLEPTSRSLLPRPGCLDGPVSVGDSRLA